MGAVFQRDIAESEEITLEAWRNRPISTRVKEVSARLWARML
jgi:cardiolipin synthase